MVVCYPEATESNNVYYPFLPVQLCCPILLSDLVWALRFEHRPEAANRAIVRNPLVWARCWTK